MSPWKNKRVLITGVCGTVGAELLRQLSALSPAEIVGLDHDEGALFFLSEQYRDNPAVSLYLCDIRHAGPLRRYFKDIDIVLHAAARKHVILNERAPYEAVQTNIIGLQHVLDAAFEANVQRLIFTSSDKAVNPTNVMGTTKLMGERLVTAANAARRGPYPIFASTRFGNVLGSSGSVIPLFSRQIRSGGPITLTDAAMSRFVMTLEEAARLVMDSVFLAHGGEVFVTKMPAIRIADLAQSMVDIFRERGDIAGEIAIKTIGAKPGEKLYEELINEEEVRRTLELERYFAVLPAFQSAYEDIAYDFGPGARVVEKIYRSDLEEVMGIEALKEYLVKNQLV